MMKDALTRMNQAQRDRLAFIDLQLRFFGEIRRRDLISRFDIQVAAATRDLALYRELAAKNLDYDTKGKVYRYGKWFTPLFDFPPDRVLTWLTRGYGDGYPDQIHSFIPTDSSGPKHTVNLDTLSAITRAINQQRVVEISYHSLTSGQSTRQFVPFALSDNGFRWYARGFDRKRQKFLDFVLTRIATAEIIEGNVLEKERPQQDNQWNRIVELELVPHPANIQHPDTIEVDFGMTDGVLKLDVRAALVGYLLRRWNVDCSADHNMRGMEYHLWLKNRPALYGVENINLAPGYE